MTLRGSAALAGRTEADGQHRLRVGGIGKPRVEASFIPEVVDRMLEVPDAASFAAIRFLQGVLGRRWGGSTGTNLWGALALPAELHAAGRPGSVVTLICDGGDRYLGTYFDDGWLASNGLDIAPHLEALRLAWSRGAWSAVT